MSGRTALKERPTLTIEQEYKGPVCGIDEVGRGPLAGPVLAACVHIPEEHYDIPFWTAVNDSKKIALKKREKLFLDIREHTAFGIGAASPEEIDTMNIHRASLLAMKRAYQAMYNQFDVKPEIALVDGKFKPALNCESQTIIKGDSVSLSIAAASILAKVTRDRIMQRLHQDFPHYGWATNAGYGTAEHMAGLSEHGPCEHHRQSFAPVAKAVRAS